MKNRALNFVAFAGLVCAGLGSVLVGCQTKPLIYHQPTTREPKTALRATKPPQPERTFTLSDDLTLDGATRTNKLTLLGDIRTDRFRQVFSSLCPPVTPPNTRACSVDLDTTDTNPKKVRYEHWLGFGQDDWGYTYMISVYWGSLADAAAWEAQGVTLPASVKEGPSDDIQAVSQSGGVHLEMTGGLALVVVEPYTNFQYQGQTWSLKELLQPKDKLKNEALVRPWYILVGREKPSGAYGSCYIMTCDDYSATKASVIWVHGEPTVACDQSEPSGVVVPQNQVAVLDNCAAPRRPGDPVPLRPVLPDDDTVRSLLKRLMNAVDPTHHPDCLP